MTEPKFMKACFVAQHVIILENVSYVLENSMYSSVGWKVLYIYTKFTYSNVSFKAQLCLLIFYVDNLSIDINGVFKSPTIIVLLLILFISVNICLIY